MIRPVRPTAPPPPPSPPRRVPSGIRHMPVSEEPVTASGDPDPSTLSLPDPPTNRQRSQSDATPEFEDETRVRPELAADSENETTRTPERADSALPTPRETPPPVDTERSFDEPETQLAERATEIPE
ncbi:MAG TPA: hypothetical protein VM925_06280, partial [Labilithrix sp.]|nr:hypothetical protein [Labilithrix sp.]